MDAAVVDAFGLLAVLFEALIATCGLIFVVAAVVGLVRIVKLVVVLLASVCSNLGAVVVGGGGMEDGLVAIVVALPFGAHDDSAKDVEAASIMAEDVSLACSVVFVVVVVVVEVVALGGNNDGGGCGGSPRATTAANRSRRSCCC